jgi:hypothetical protein
MNVHKRLFTLKLLAQMFNNIYSESYKLWRPCNSLQNTDSQWVNRLLGGEPCGSPAISLQITVSLVQWVNRVLPNTGGSGSRPGGAHTLQELGLSY